MSIRGLFSAGVAYCRLSRGRSGPDPARLLVAFLAAAFAVAATSAPPSAYDIYRFDVRGLRLGDSPRHAVAILSKNGAVHVERVYCEAARIKSIKHHRDPSGVSQPDADCVANMFARLSRTEQINVRFTEDLTKRTRPVVATTIQYEITDLLPGDASVFEKHAIAKYGPPNNPDAFGWRGKLCGPDCHAPSLVISAVGDSISTVLSDAGLVTRIHTIQRNLEQQITSSASLTP